MFDELFDDEIGDRIKNSSIQIGDMILSQEQYEYLYSNDTSKRHGLRRSINHWPNGVVPIKIDDEIDDEFREVLKSAMNYISSVSCIQFDLAPEDPKDFVLIKIGQGCSSQVGNLRQGMQTIRLHPICKRGNIIHEFLHTLGFLHMHTAVTRDNYVAINYKNIKPLAMKNFEKYTVYVSMFDTMYDYRSIMHYSRKAFAINKSKPTIIPAEHVSSMGQRESKLK